MTFQEIAKLLETNIQTIPNLVSVLKRGFEEAEAGSDVEVTQVISSGTKIASIAVGEESTDIFAPTSEVNYSTTERKIGKWIDNSDLYQKTIAFTPESTITADTTIETIEGIEIKEITAIATNTEDNRAYQIPYITGNKTTQIIMDEGNIIKIKIANDSWSNEWTFLITIKYTKTAA